MIIHQLDDLVFPCFLIPDQESDHSSILKLNEGHKSFFEKQAALRQISIGEMGEY